MCKFKYLTLSKLFIAQPERQQRTILQSGHPNSYNIECMYAGGDASAKGVLLEEQKHPFWSQSDLDSIQIPALTFTTCGT